MKNIEKTLNEELRNNDCIENLVNAIDSKKSIYDAFVVDGKLVIVFNDELETNEVEQIQTMLKRMDGCGEVFSDEFELGYKGNFKSLTLDLLTDNVSIGKFEQGGDVESEKHEHLSGIAYFVLFDDVQDEDEFQKLTENVLTKQEFEQAKYSDQIREFDFDIHIEAKSWNIIPAIYDQMEKEGKERGQIIGYDIVNQSNTHKRFTSDLPYDEDYENQDYEYAKGGELRDDGEKEIKKEIGVLEEKRAKWIGQSEAKSVLTSPYDSKIDNLQKKLELIRENAIEKYNLKSIKGMDENAQKKMAFQFYLLLEKTKSLSKFISSLTTPLRKKTWEKLQYKSYRNKWGYKVISNKSADTIRMEMIYAKGGEMEDYYDGQGDEGYGNTFEELRSQIVLGVMEDLRIPRETAQKVVDEKKEMLTDLIENHGETNIYSLVQKAQEEDDSYARHMETRKRMRNDEDTYPKGFNEFAKGGNVRSKGDEITLTKSEINKYIKLSQKIDELIERQDKLSHNYNDENDILERNIRNLSENLQDFEEQLYEKYNDRSKVMDLLSSHIYETYAKGGMLDKYEFIDSLTDIYKIRSKWFAIGKRYGIETKGEGYTKKEALENLDLHLSYVTEKDKYAKGGEVKKIPTTTQVKRNLRGSGAFTLELEMAVYVPSTTVADQIISKTLFQKRIQEVEKYLSKLFGGYSSNAVEGGYVSQEKGLIKEDVAKVTAFGTEDAIKKNFKPLMRQISKWCESWGQESMGFEFEGDLYYVSKDAKFSKGGKIENKPVKPKFVKNAKK